MINILRNNFNAKTINANGCFTIRTILRLVLLKAAMENNSSLLELQQYLPTARWMENW